MVYFAMALALFAGEDYEQVWVPTQNALGVAGYAIYDGNPATSASMGTISVTQAGNAGQWVTLGRYPVSGSSLEIRVAPATGTGQGTGQAPGHNSAIAASAASAHCGSGTGRPLRLML
jgi:hypothetical protein